MTAAPGAAAPVAVLLTAAPTAGVVPGGAVWAALALALVAWLVCTQVAGPRRLPGITAVLGWWLRSWLGRLVLLAAWAGAGWHLFCQRP